MLSFLVSKLKNKKNWGLNKYSGIAPNKFMETLVIRFHVQIGLESHELIRTEFPAVET